MSPLLLRLSVGLPLQLEFSLCQVGLLKLHVGGVLGLLEASGQNENHVPRAQSKAAGVEQDATIADHNT
eukprot:scaffold287996_cov34-Prasinocladus_malaysianus.AAC.1